jgi:hypothetical protein
MKSKILKPEFKEPSYSNVKVNKVRELIRFLFIAAKWRLKL